MLSRDLDIVKKQILMVLSRIRKDLDKSVDKNNPFFFALLIIYFKEKWLIFVIKKNNFYFL